jgi:hypothetical protein
VVLTSDLSWGPLPGLRIVIWNLFSRPSSPLAPSASVGPVATGSSTSARCAAPSTARGGHDLGPDLGRDLDPGLDPDAAVVNPGASVSDSCAANIVENRRCSRWNRVAADSAALNRCRCHRSNNAADGAENQPTAIGRDHVNDRGLGPGPANEACRQRAVSDPSSGRGRSKWRQQSRYP